MSSPFGTARPQNSKEAACGDRDEPGVRVDTGSHCGRTGGARLVAADGGTGRPRLRPLSVVDDGDQVIIGDLDSGRFVAVPPVGGVVVRALQDGASLAE